MSAYQLAYSLLFPFHPFNSLIPYRPPFLVHPVQITNVRLYQLAYFRDLIASAMAGYNATIFAYGQVRRGREAGKAKSRGKERG